MGPISLSFFYCWILLCKNLGESHIFIMFQGGEIFWNSENIDGMGGSISSPALLKWGFHNSFILFLVLSPPRFLTKAILAVLFSQAESKPDPEFFCECFSLNKTISWAWKRACLQTAFKTHFSK